MRYLAVTLLTAAFAVACGPVAEEPRLADESVETSQPVRLVKRDREPRNDSVDERQTRAHCRIRREGDDGDPGPE